MSLKNKIQALLPHQSLLKKSKFGLEKEGLRVASKGGIAHTPHPKAFGSALTNPFITTDFSEALLELITPACSLDDSLDFLSQTQKFVYNNLENNELLWAQSMPCVIRGETSIPLAQYGKSNLGQMKTIYRQGLGCRYGRTMQVIAGIHINYSYSLDFWQAYQSVLGDRQLLQTFINQHYMGLIRNLLRFGWLNIYLFGASPAVCKSFLKNYHKHNLEPFTKNSLYEPFATSLRMGDIGYQNSQEDKMGFKADYNSLSHYTNGLRLAMQTHCMDYQAFEKKINGKYQQLNANVLQIENEYYASVRPKQTPQPLEKPTDALDKRGIEYIELRSLDINPLNPLGVDKEQLLFIESFLLFCLIQPSAIICSNEKVAIDNNINLVAHSGRNPALNLEYNQDKISLKQWGKDLCADILSVTKLLGKQHTTAVKNISKRLDEPQLTPSQTLLSKLQADNVSFFDLSKNLSLAHQKTLQSKAINPTHKQQLIEAANNSIKQQIILENNQLPFEQYLHHYFSS